VIQETSRTVEVSPFLSSMGRVDDVPIATCVVAYDDPTTYTTYMLIFHEALYITDLEHNLLCPNQLRFNGLQVNSLPRIFDADRLPRTHTIEIPAPDALTIPLLLDGMTSYFPTRRPTMEEFNHSVRRIDMTSSAEWNPNDPRWAREEEAFYNSSRSPADEMYRVDRNVSTVACYLNDLSPALNDDNLSRLLEGTRYIGASKTSKRKGTVTAEVLAKKWDIGLKQAEKVIKATTQRGVRDFTDVQGTKRLNPTAYQLKFRHLRTAMYSDTMFSPYDSLNQNTCAQVYADGKGWVRAIPMKSKGEAPDSLSLLHRRVGVPETMISDDAPELVSGEFRKRAIKAGSHISPVEAYTPQHNMAEGDIRELKRMWKRAMRKSNCPTAIWDHCFELQALIRSHLVSDRLENRGAVPEEVITGDTPDISNLSEFAWYEWVWYHPRPGEAKLLGKWLGPSHEVGQAMCSKVLTSKARVVSRTSVFPLSTEDVNSEVVKQMKKDYVESLKEKLGDRMNGIANDEPDEDDVPEFDLYGDNDGGDEPGMPEADDLDHDAFDKYISAEVILPRNEDMVMGKVIRRKRDADGNLIGRSNINPVLDSSVYEVEFPDGEVEAYATNVIAENMYSQVDSEGHHQLVMEEIVDHKKDGSAVAKDDAQVEVNGRTSLRRTTKGWKLCVQWKDGSTSWVALKDLKESNPVELAEYAVNRKLVSEPAFAWWVPHTLKRRDRIIKANKSRYMKKSHKFGIELPKTVKRALEIDGETGTTYWHDAICKQVKAVKPAFRVLELDENIPVGSQQVPYHIIFDVKMDFTRKARLVVGGHVTEPPASITYASVVSRDSVRLAFMLAALNDLDILAADVADAYLNAPCREKVHIICGAEFGPDAVGRPAVVVRAIFGLKSSGASWRAHLAQTLRDQGFECSLADNDVWMRPAVKADGSKYYEYVLVYTDDILAIAMDPRRILMEIDQHYLLKPDSIGEPKTYLGATITKFYFSDEPTKVRWAMSSGKYVKDAIRNVEWWLSERSCKLKSKAPSVLPTGYRPELDVSKELTPDLANLYQQHIGILRWAVELGRIDIATEASMLASFSACPREGHLDAVFHMYSYLKCHDRSTLVFDDSYVVFTNDDPSQDQDWSDFYPDAKEAIPPNAPEPRGKPVQLTSFVDSDHAGDTVTRRSRTGVLIYANRSPILWYTKKQGSIETSTFGSEFMALKTATELVLGLRYKLRMMGVPLEGPANMRVDNMSVVNNTTAPESTLKKKSNSIAYHFVRENAAAGTIKIGYEPSETNLSDCLTKIQPGPVRQGLVQQILW